MRLGPYSDTPRLTKRIDDLPAHERDQFELIARFEEGVAVAAEGDDVQLRARFRLGRGVRGGCRGGMVGVGGGEDVLGDALEQVGVDFEDVGFDVAAVRVEEGFVAFGGWPGAEVEGSQVGQGGEAGLGGVLARDGVGRAMERSRSFVSNGCFVCIFRFPRHG